MLVINALILVIKDFQILSRWNDPKSSQHWNRISALPNLQRFCIAKYIYIFNPKKSQRTCSANVARTISIHLSTRKQLICFVWYRSRKVPYQPNQPTPHAAHMWSYPPKSEPWLNLQPATFPAGLWAPQFQSNGSDSQSHPTHCELIPLHFPSSSSRGQIRNSHQTGRRQCCPAQLSPYQSRVKRTKKKRADSSTAIFLPFCPSHILRFHFPDFHFPKHTNGIWMKFQNHPCYLPAKASSPAAFLPPDKRRAFPSYQMKLHCFPLDYIIYKSTLTTTTPPVNHSSPSVGNHFEGFSFPRIHLLFLIFPLPKRLFRAAFELIVLLLVSSIDLFLFRDQGGRERCLAMWTEGDFPRNGMDRNEHVIDFLWEISVFCFCWSWFLGFGLIWLCFFVGSCSKSRIKLISKRISVIKKRRIDTIGFLKNAMAELLENGLDINAYGRVIYLSIYRSVRVWFWVFPSS